MHRHGTGCEVVTQHQQAIRGEDIADGGRDRVALHAIRSGLDRLSDVRTAVASGREGDAASDRWAAEVATDAVLEIDAHEEIVGRDVAAGSLKLRVDRGLEVPAGLRGLTLGESVVGGEGRKI